MKIVYHGPNTIYNFKHFSLDSLRSKLKQTSPALFELFLSLSRKRIVNSGDCADSIPEGQSDDDTRAISSLLVVLKNRSAKVLGIQLFIGMMLVGRTTSRRVRQGVITQY